MNENQTELEKAADQTQVVADSQVENTNKQQAEEIQAVETKNQVDDAANWSEARKVLNAQKRRIEELEEKLNEFARPKQVVAPEPEVDELDKLDPSEYLSVEQARKLVESRAEKKAKKTTEEVLNNFQIQQRVLEDEKRMRSREQDYDYVFENYVAPLLKKDPALAHYVRNSETPAETAYMIGKLSPQYKQNEVPTISPKAEKIIKNSQKPIPPHAVSGETPLKDQVNAFENLSKSDIWRLSQKYAGSG